MNFLFIYHAHAAITSEIAGGRPNPYTLDKLQYYRIGPNQAASDLWRYRFAIPIVFNFKTHPFSDVRQSPHFHFDVLKEVYPLLLLPNFYGDKLGNPFYGVKEEHYDQSDCTVDLTVILAEIVSAYREKRDVNYAVLAEKFSLLGTMIAIEEFVNDFDPSMFVDQNADEVKAMVALRKKLDAMAVEVYRPAGADSKVTENGFLKDKAYYDHIHPVYFEMLTGTEKIWKVIKPNLRRQDMEALLATQAWRFDLPISNPDFLTEDICEAINTGFEYGHALSFPVDFFAKHFKGNVHLFVESCLGPELHYEIDRYVVSLTCESAGDIKLSDRRDRPMDVFLARRFLSLATASDGKVPLQYLQRFNVSLRETINGIKKGVVSGDEVLRLYDEYLQGVKQGTCRGIDLEYLIMICEDHPDIALPKFDYIVDTVYMPKLTQSALIFDKALASGDLSLARRVSNRDLFQYRNYCAKIAALSDQEAAFMLKSSLYCLYDVLKLKPQLPFMWDACNRSTFSYAYQTSDLEYLADDMIIHEIGEKERSLLYAMRGTESVRTSSLFLAQFGQIVPDLSSFQHLSLSTMAQIIFGSKTLKPHLYQFATELFKKTTFLRDRHEYFKLASLYFEVFPAAMENDTQLASYLNFLLESIGAASDMQVDLPQGNPFHREILKMDEHLFYILSNRVIKHEKAAFRGLFKRFNVKGTLVNIQLSETDQELVEACDEYFANFFFNAQIMEDLLSVLKNSQKALFICCLERAAETWKEDWNGDEIQSFLLNVVPKHMEPSLELAPGVTCRY